ncbi:hypothetical protein D9757_009380 [Collybiopsis confluens]|uniref:Uncharacterized protein n=1 Tax=Collybiopsis confluens TaxID=2823264 RepID=A0A8H5H6X8_9AGAR|nr:hypothetical protein D9757_009380 [Collybiopsis confluens]
MDPALHPPINIQSLSARKISTKNAAKRIGNFIDDFEARTMAAGGSGNTAVTVQLQKLKAAMQEEAAKKDAKK